ncbi:MAG: nitroreductase family protein [Aeromonas sp.]
MDNPVIAQLKARRTIYALGKDVAQPTAHLEALITHAIKQCPSAFNSQSSRAVILWGAAHHALWDMVKAELKKVVPAEAFTQSAQKIDGAFAAGLGSVLFFEDTAVIAGLQQQFPAYADNFPIWSEHASGMAQLAVWTALASEGVGASLQHYNPLIDAAVSAHWQLPASWKLRAQMPFGSIEQGAGEKTFIDDAARIKIFRQ